MRHDVARRVQFGTVGTFNVRNHRFTVQFGTALVHSTYGITASQWTCRARARDAGKANSYQLIIFSYCLIFMAAVSAAIYLVYRVFGGKAVYARVGVSSVGAIVGGGVGGTPGSIALRGEKLGEVLDGVTMLLMKLSFVLLWTGIAMGAIWADHSWGRPWGWDPKEVFALNTFVVFAILVHVRYRSKDKGLWTAILAVVGAAVMLFNWIVINFIITGLHSYA